MNQGDTVSIDIDRPFKELSRRDVADWLEQPVVVEPVNPLKCGELDVFETSPWVSRFHIAK